MAKLVHFFLDADLRCSHDGLLAFLKKKKIVVSDNDFIVFLNSKRSMIKMLCKGKEVLLHYKKDGRVIDPGIIPYLPKYCDGKEMNMDGAMKEHLQDVLRRRGHTIKEPEEPKKKAKKKKKVKTILRKAKVEEPEQKDLFDAN